MTYPAGDPEIMYDLAKSRFERQLADVDAIDAKLSGFFAAGSALLGIVAAIYAIRPETFKWGGVIVLSMAAVAWAALAAASLFWLGPRTWETGPVMEAVYADYRKNVAGMEIKWRVIGKLLQLHKANSPAYDRKVAVAIASPILLAVESALVVAAAVMVAVHG